MKITLDSNPSDAPCCLKITAENGQDLLVQTDWDWPGIASHFGWDKTEVLSDNATAYFNRFELTLPRECAKDCSHQGPCDEDVEYWYLKLHESIWPNVDAVKCELKEYGAWSADELNSPHENNRRLLWLAVGQINEAEPCEHSGTDGTIDCPECGAKAYQFIQAARQWLDDNDGAQTEDPGYFGN